MAERLILHIGCPKSGTTFLQSVMWQNRELLAERGFLLPGQVPYDHNRIAQFVRYTHPDENARRTWRQAKRSVRSWPGTAIISNEWMCGARAGQIQRTLNSFGDAEVHVVVTVRNLVRTVPSAWQEVLKLGTSRTLDEFIESLDDPTERWKWSTLDPSLILPAWRERLPAGRVHLVTVPAAPSAPEVVWHRFAHACGLDPEGIDLHVGKRNESISAEGARLLQLVGPQMRAAIDADNIAWNQAYRWIRHRFSHDILVPQRGSAIGLLPHQQQLLDQHAKDVITRLEEADYDVVGDLQDLLGAPSSRETRVAEEVPEHDVLELALQSLASLLALARQEGIRADRAERRLARLENAPILPEQVRRPVRRTAGVMRRTVKAGAARARRSRPRQRTTS